MTSRAEYGLAIGVVAATALATLPLRNILNPIDVAMVFLLAVVVVAARARRGPALLACALAILAFDVLFVPPYYRLTVADADFLLTFAVMLAVALLMTRLTTRIREQAAAAIEGERRTRARFALSQELAGTGVARVREVLANALERVVGVPGRMVVAADLGPDGGPPQWPVDDLFRETEVRVAATWAVQHGELAGHGTLQGAEGEALILPIATGHRRVGVMAFATARAGRTVSPADQRLLRELLAEGAVALDRALLAEGQETARLAVEAEQLRTSLLSSLSHDLRTPLANIEGAASSLLDPGAVLESDVRRELAEGILVESRRMHRLMTNLLDMVRLETGSLAVSRTWQPLEEAVGVALLRLEERLAGRTVTIQLPADLPLVPIDELLVEQVLINLLDNAIKHTPPGTAITVSAIARDDVVEVEVADRGPGLPAGQEESVFGKFYQASARGGAAPAGGAGLGLTICRGIVTAHGGRIWAESKPEGGVAFRFTLPLTGPPPGAIPREPPEG